MGLTSVCVATTKHLDLFDWRYVLILVFVEEVAKAIINLFTRKLVHMVG